MPLKDKPLQWTGTTASALRNVRYIYFAVLLLRVTQCGGTDANTWCPPTFTQELWDEVRIFVRAGVRVVRLKLAEPTRNSAARTALPIEPDEVHVIQLLGAHYEL
jgi:hypothetical protein